MSSSQATHELERPKLTPGVQALIATSIAVMFVQITAVKYSDISAWFGFDAAALPSRGWTALTYLFVHASPWHVAANMYALYLFGPRVEQAWGGGPKRFLWFYALCGLGGVVVDLVFIRGGVLVGSSAAVFGVMTAYLMQWPDEEVYFLFVMPLRVRTLVAAFFAVNIVTGLLGTGAGFNVVYFAHIGGAITAYVYMRMATSTSMDQVRQRVANLPDADEPPRAIPRSMPRRERGDEVDDIVAKSKAIAAKRVTALTPGSRRREARAEELNRVLDKISQQGIESLTSDERKVLEEMSRRLRDR